jgi:hypothetical protein
MKKYISLLIILGSLFGGLGCQSEEKEQQEAVTSFAPDTIFSEQYAYLLKADDKSCLESAENIICEWGVASRFLLGQNLDELDFTGQQVTVKDTLYTQSGYQWRGKEIAYPEGGQIVLEGQFVDEGDPGQQLPLSTLNRIRVESPAFATQSGLKVGDPFSKLAQTYPDSLFVAIYIPSIEMVDLTIPKLSGLHYNLPLKLEVELEEGYQGMEISTDMIPDTTRLQSIVIAF